MACPGCVLCLLFSSDDMVRVTHVHLWKKNQERPFFLMLQG